MKKITIFLLLSVLFADVTAQQATQAPALTKQDYIQKSKRQKTAAWILLGGGATLSAGGIIWALESDWLSNDSGPDILFFTGAASMLGSIPVFIASSRNKKRAMRVGAIVKMEKITVLQQNTFARRRYPAVGVQLRLPAR